MLDNDPVPRAFLSVDPVYQMLMTRAPSAISSLLSLRDSIFGPGLPLSKTRFLFELVGQVRSNLAPPNELTTNPDPTRANPNPTYADPNPYPTYANPNPNPNPNPTCANPDPNPNLTNPNPNPNPNP